MLYLKLYTICMLVSRFFCTGQIEDLSSLLPRFRIFKISIFNDIKQSVESENNMKLLGARNKLQPTIKRSTRFPCSLNITKSSDKPLSVHQLRPGDINVIAGIGDSITAGVGLTATNSLQVPYENRGMSPTAGGSKTWKEYFTLPNFLKEFNPQLIGYATDSSLTIHKESVFNLGETGALSEDIPYMAQLLIQRMKANPSVSIQNDWKMVTYMVGPNDFCTEICFHDNLTLLLENHKNDLVHVLNTLKRNLPRTIVNIIPSPNVKIITELSGISEACKIDHILECPCIFGPRQKDRQLYFKFIEKWQQMDIKVANYPEYDLDDFTVVVQPFSLHFFIPRKMDGYSDLTYLSEDCFHMSQKGNARIALSLWNNIFQPVGKKSKYPSPLNSAIKCPTEDNPYIYTRRNSYTFFNN